MGTIKTIFGQPGGGDGMQSITPAPDTMMGKLLSKVKAMKTATNTPGSGQTSTPGAGITDTSALEQAGTTGGSQLEQDDSLSLKMDELTRLVNKLSSAGDGLQTSAVSYIKPQEQAPIISSLPDNNRAATVSKDGGSRNIIIILIAGALILVVLFFKTKQVM